ncbi:hypothetical protein FQS96_12090 [Enterococcus faecalis]|uniref:hypothetical protein n=1 Tax=Enterococcus TaxID=1350 RepID=UPI001A96257B|nr:hypothetical protein [Enterococcus faecalis]MBO1126195.1 hypothetical protein [Enterococcus faecalis]
MDRIDAETTLLEIQALHFCIGNFLNELANLSIGCERNEVDAMYKLASVAINSSDHLNTLNGILYDKINELEGYILNSYEQKQELTSSANEVSH